MGRQEMKHASLTSRNAALSGRAHTQAAQSSTRHSTRTLTGLRVSEVVTEVTKIYCE